MGPRSIPLGPSGEATAAPVRTPANCVLLRVAQPTPDTGLTLPVPRGLAVPEPDQEG